MFSEVLGDISELSRVITGGIGQIPDRILEKKKYAAIHGGVSDAINV